MPHMGPGLRGCNPIGLHRPFATNYAIPAYAGTHSAAGVELSDGTRSQRRSNSGACVEAWVPACAGMARKGNSRIVTMFIEANWVTASFAGKTRTGALNCIVRMNLSTSERKPCAPPCPWVFPITRARTAPLTHAGADLSAAEVQSVSLLCCLTNSKIC